MENTAQGSDAEGLVRVILFKWGNASGYSRSYGHVDNININPRKQKIKAILLVPAKNAPCYRKCMWFLCVYEGWGVVWEWEASSLKALDNINPLRNILWNDQTQRIISQLEETFCKDSNIFGYPMNKSSKQRLLLYRQNNKHDKFYRESELVESNQLSG